ncbi:hypothetical protein NSQ77_17840 [Oceanobacillus sp. FSL K6-2867]
MRVFELTMAPSIMIVASWVAVVSGDESTIKSNERNSGFISKKHISSTIR